MARLTLAAVAAGIAGSALAASPFGPGSPAWTQAQALLAKMSQAQKLLLVHGSGGPYVGDVPSITLSDGTILPPWNLEDGPQGVADGVQHVTCWPSALTVVQSWDADAMYRFGEAMGREQYLKGTNILLGPGVNLARVPWCGRNFEYQGEDPVLASVMAAAEIKGIQSQNVSGCVKHYVQNNEETNRGSMSANVPQRAAKELYYKPFAAAVDAGVGTAMCSYNRINRTYACENPETLGALKNDYGFAGYVMSDWGATHSTVAAANAGLDQQMPDASFFGSALAAAIANGSVPQSRLDDMVTRMLAAGVYTNLFSDPQTNPARNLSAVVTSPEHAWLAQDLAMRSITLLQNDNAVLPVNPNAIASIAVFGDENSVHGAGSGGVNAEYVITPFQGIYTALNGNFTPPARAANCTQEVGFDYYQPGNANAPAASPAQCCAICAANSECNAWTFQAPTAKQATGTCWLKPDASGRKPSPGLISGNCTAPAPPMPPGRVNVTYLSGQDPVAAAALASAVDVAVVVVATTSSEGSDRQSLDLPDWQNALVAAVAAANKRTIVVARCPGACTMPWADSVPAILFELMPGQMSGASIAATVFGANNPSGKLPVSFPTAMNATWLSLPNVPGPINPMMWPGTDRGNGFLEADYTEELSFGYRFFDARPDVAPLWPFGHGLSYTTFTYGNLVVAGTVTPTASATVYATVCNSGAVEGSEVAQLYIGYPTAANEPPKQLKGFSKIPLVPGQCGALAVPLAAADLQIWDAVSQSWQLVAGAYNVYVGSSSRDIRLTGTLTVTA